jgi:DNA replication licensing factor MCM4
MIIIFDAVIKKLYHEYFIANQENDENVEAKLARKQRLLGSIKGLPESFSLREIDHQQINQLVSIKGIVIRCSEVIPEMNAAHFRCCNCEYEVYLIL